jgi:hypothetical protein
MAGKQIPIEELEIAVQAYYDYSGNKSEAARALGLNRCTYKDRLKVAESRLGIRLNKVADGTIQPSESKILKLPKKGYTKRYILTSIQNNTHLHPAFNNILALKDYLDNYPKSSCDLLIGTYSYQLSSYGPKAVKRGKYKAEKALEELWYAREAEDFIVDESVELAPGLVWCGEQNILPTAKHPLTSFEDYNGRKSNIVPHAKIEMESVASMAKEATKFNYSTGTITQRNYIKKRAGILAEQKHSYGALLVEVDSQGNWYVRQLHVDDNDAIMDIGPSGTSGIYVQTGMVTERQVTEAIYWGDAHAHELELWVRECGWGRKGMLQVLKPKYQFLGDVFSMHTRGHHEINDFHSRYSKFAKQEESVEDEVQLTTDFTNEATKKWCKTIIVPSNHDRHLERWLNEADFRKDPLNSKYFCYLQYNLLNAMDKGDSSFNVLEFAMTKAGLNPLVEFLPLNQSCIIKGIENGLHGDMGPNGSRGSTRSLTKLGRPVNKGHDHTAAIRDQVYSAGACSLDFGFMNGPDSHSISHIVTYSNGTRSIVTMYNNKWRA